MGVGKKNMKGMIISSNLLFSEVVMQALTRYFDNGYIFMSPEHVIDGEIKNSPDLILIDNSIQADLLKKTVEIVSKLKSAQIILINPGSNDCQVFKSPFSTIKNLEEFMRMIVTESKQKKYGKNDHAYKQFQEDAQVRSEMYSFLAGILNHRPDTDFVHGLQNVGVGIFMQILKEEKISRDLEMGFSLMATYIQKSSNRPDAQVEQDLSVDWTRLFRGIQPGYGPTPPYETEYRSQIRDSNQFLQLLISEYNSNGAIIDALAGNRPDYLGLEIAYISFLLSQEAEAWKMSDSAKAEELAFAAESFIDHHLTPWVGIFCEKAQTQAHTDFYKGYLMVMKSIFLSK